MTATRPEAAGGRGEIRFVLDGTVRTVRGFDPNTTVLNYLREDLRRTGTKEGCAEGDCGACTVVVAERDGDGLRYRAINSCIQFLATLDGKALFTVESLKGADGSLHPVQQAMVDCHGSQCGFCTPGFVMSLFALYKSEPPAALQRIDDVLAGNLCRCTGYRPIVDAARRMYDLGAAIPAEARDRMTAAFSDTAAHDGPAAAQLKAIERQTTLDLTGPAVQGGDRRFFAPVRLDELATLVVEHPDAVILAGGTDVGLWVTKDHRDLDTVIYVGDVADLKAIDVTATHIEIGAGATLSDAHETIAAHYPDFGELLRRFASPPIRNAATLGGNVVNGSPIGDSMPALIALGATVVLRKGDATRTLPIEDLYLGYRQTALAAGELLERVEIPLPSPGRLFATYKISKRFDQDISAVCGAFCVRRRDGAVVDVRIGYGGMAATPKRAANCEVALAGKPWTETNVTAAMDALDRDFAPIDDMRASATYRQLVAKNLLHRFYLETSGGEPVATRVLAYAE